MQRTIIELRTTWKSESKGWLEIQPFGVLHSFLMHELGFFPLSSVIKENEFPAQGSDKKDN